LQRDAAFDAWIEALPDLDAQDEAASRAAIADNPEFGSSEPERLERLAGARRIATVLNGLAIGAAGWGYLYPRPYGLAVASLVLLPWVALLLVFRSHGLFRVSTQRNDVRPSLAPCLYVPGFALLARAVGDVGVIDLTQAFAVALAVGVVLALVAIASDVSARTPAAIFGLIVLCGPYGYGAAVTMNALVDRSARQDFKVPVLTRYMTHGRSTSYHLRLAPWGPRSEQNDVMVSQAVYSAPGDTVCIQLKAGALGIRWFWIGRCA
jgi:hypothetical protein